MIAWVSRQGGVVIQATRDLTVKTVQKAADLAMQAGSMLYTVDGNQLRDLGHGNQTVLFYRGLAARAQSKKVSTLGI